MFRQLRCPIKTCDGWVCEVEETLNSKFYGCGTCGNIWNQLSDLFVAIEKITSECDYRKRVYYKSVNSWHPVDLEEEPENYVDLVLGEWER